MKTLIVYDCSSIHSLVEKLRKQQDKVRFAYKEAQTLFSDYMKTVGWEEPEEIALVTVDQMTDGQKFFIKMLESTGIKVEKIDYRIAIPSQPIGARRLTADYVDMSSYFTYILGLKANDPINIIMVTRSFGLFGPLTNYISRGGNACIAFHKKHLDGRWLKEINIDGYKPGKINFINFEDHLLNLFGLETVQEVEDSGLSSL